MEGSNYKGQRDLRHHQKATRGSIQNMIRTLIQPQTGEAGDLMDKLRNLISAESPEQKEKREQAEREKLEQRDKAAQLVANIRALQEKAATLASSTMDGEIRSLLSSITQTEHTNPGTGIHTPEDKQQQFMEQLRRALGAKTEAEDPQRTILKQFLTSSNTMTTSGGATTLKPNLLKQLTGEEEDFNMAEWLAMFNKQDQGESRFESEEEKGWKPSKSGILDRATSNIQKKEVWPQRNLMEDWADEEMTFSQLQFEHHVAGEARTIETCTVPAQILGRLKVLCRMAYAKLRGYEWPLVRKMYAAILTSIEAGENSWDFNFDHFETILYRKSQLNKTSKEKDRDREVKKWYCREYNRPEGCDRNSPHKGQVGSAGITRTVIHMCSLCWRRDRLEKRHPEGHEACPHKE